MAEILTESFCERCGSRYTFESAVPRARLRGMKVLSRGFKNFVLDDKTSMDEALAAARDDTDRDLTSHQLEAFHKTFNFCMQCRQYICPNCWNDAEGRCLTCAPMLGHGMLPAPFPDLDPSDGIAASNENGLAAAAMNGHKHASEPPDGLDAVADLDALTPVSTPIPPAPEMIGTSEVEARAEAAEAEAVEATSVEAANDAFATAEAAAVAEAIEIAALAATDLDAPVAEEPLTDAVEAVPEAIVEDEAVIAAPTVSTEPEPDVTASVPPAEATISEDVDEASERAAAAAHTSFLLEGLRPGESLDDAIAAFESQPTVAAELEQLELGPVEAATTDDIPATPETPVVVEALDIRPAGPDDVTFAAVIESADTMWAPAEEPLVDVPVVADAAPSEPASPVEPLDEIPTGDALRTGAAIETPAEPEPTLHAELPLDDVASVEAVVTEPVVSEPVVTEPVVSEPVATEPAPEPATPSSPVPSEVAAVAATDDVVDQPTWSIVAPTPETIDEVPGPIADAAIEPPAAPPAEAVPAPDQEPSWPAQPQWPSPQPSLGLPFLGRHVVPTGGVDALWAESDLAVGGPRAGTEKPAGGVQPCVSCGLSLSASARFCRRCGTSQVG